MPVARQSSSLLPASGPRRSATIDAKSSDGSTAGRASCSGVAVTAVSASGCTISGELGSTASGTEAFAKVEFATLTSVGSVGPACAGAIVAAVSAAQISSAERKEAKNKSRNSAVNHRNSDASLLANTTARACRDTPSRVASFGVSCQEDAPRSCCWTRVSSGRPRGSTHAGRFSDESFRICDIELDRPEILVEPCAIGDESCNLFGTCRIARSNGLPTIASIEVQNALQAGEMPASASH